MDRLGLVRGGAGTALVGSHEEVADRLADYHALGIDEVILSGYPHVEEAWTFAEGVDAGPASPRSVRRSGAARCAPRAGAADAVRHRLTSPGEVCWSNRIGGQSAS